MNDKIRKLFEEAVEGVECFVDYDIGRCLYQKAYEQGAKSRQPEIDKLNQDRGDYEQCLKDIAFFCSAEESCMTIEELAGAYDSVISKAQKCVSRRWKAL